MGCRLVEDDTTALLVVAIGVVLGSAHNGAGG